MWGRVTLRFHGTWILTTCYFVRNGNEVRTVPRTLVTCLVTLSCLEVFNSSRSEELSDRRQALYLFWHFYCSELWMLKTHWISDFYKISECFSSQVNTKVQHSHDPAPEFFLFENLLLRNSLRATEERHSGYFMVTRWSPPTIIKFGS